MWWEIRNEFGVISLTEVLEVIEVIHECFILKELALSEDCNLDNSQRSIQFRYCGFANDCRNSKSVSKRRRSFDSAIIAQIDNTQTTCSQSLLIVAANRAATKIWNFLTNEIACSDLVFTPAHGSESLVITHPLRRQLLISQPHKIKALGFPRGVCWGSLS